ncbi:hypothetical protein EON83_21155, partial [bacterium]
MKHSVSLCLALLPLVPLVVFAQPQKAPAPTTGAGVVDIANGPGGITTYDGAKDIGHMTKDIVITQKGENLIVYAQDVVYSRNKNQATATGQLRVLTRDSTIRGQKIFADFKARQFIISGNVSITTHGKTDGAMSGLRSETTNKPVRVLCDRVVWEYDTRQATATGNIRMSQGPNSGTCNTIFYDEPSNTIELQGNVRFIGEKGRNMRSQKVTFYVNKDFAFSNSPSRVSITQTDDPETPRAPKPTKTFDPAPSIPA